MLKRFRLAIGIAGILAVGLTAVLLWPQDFVVRQTAQEAFYLDLPFNEVRKILVRTRATDEIMAVGDSGELKEYTFTNRALGLETLNIFNPQWQVHAEAVMKVQTSDEEYVGSHLITLRQDVEIRNDLLKSTILLDEGTERLRDYENITVFSPAGERTQVETSLTLSILVTAPAFARDYAAARILANASGKLENQVAAIQRTVQKNKDRPLPLLPLLGGNEDSGEQGAGE